VCVFGDDGSNKGVLQRFRTFLRKSWRGSEYPRSDKQNSHGVLPRWGAFIRPPETLHRSTQEHQKGKAAEFPPPLSI
jgi:hypothetical protein